MNLLFLSTIYWSKTVKLLLLYFVVILFIIAIVLLINEIFFKRENDFLNSQKENKIKRILSYKKLNKNYLKPDVKEEIEEDILPAFNEQCYVPKKHTRILTYVKKEKVYLPIQELTHKENIIDYAPIKHQRVISYIKKEKEYLPIQKIIHKENIEKYTPNKNQKVISYVKKEKVYLNPSNSRKSEEHKIKRVIVK